MLGGGRNLRVVGGKDADGRDDRETAVPRLHMVLPEEVRVTWPLVRERVLAIAQECSEPWIAEDVFLALMPRVEEGRLRADAFLWATPGLDAFLVLQIAEQVFGRDLHCWICFNESPEPLAAFWPQLQAIAREHACGRVTFDSDRGGFNRMIPGMRRRYLWSADVGGNDGRD